MLLVLIDDAGFGNPSTFGGPVDTPNFTRMAEAGLRYNRFHVTALTTTTSSSGQVAGEHDPGRLRDPHAGIKEQPAV